MGVSRPVISAGLVELEKLGFVEIVPRQGVYVSDYRRKGTVETLVAIMPYSSRATSKILSLTSAQTVLTQQLIMTLRHINGQSSS